MRPLAFALAVGLSLVASVGTARADAPAPSASAKAFLDGIYAQYVGKDGKGVPLATDADVRRLFAPSLAKAILDDRARAAKRGDVPTLDGDPFIDAQDWQFDSAAAFAISVDARDATHAVGTVRFTNLGRASTVTLDLVKQKNGWRVAEIRSPSGSLSSLFRKGGGPHAE